MMTNPGKCKFGGCQQHEQVPLVVERHTKTEPGPPLLRTSILVPACVATGRRRKPLQWYPGMIEYRSGDEGRVKILEGGGTALVIKQ